MSIAPLLQALTQTPDRIRDLVNGLSEPALHRRAGSDMWSAHMVMAHLVHAEPLFRARLARIATENYPTLPAFGPREAPPISDQPVADLLAALHTSRAETLALLYDLSPSAWERPAIHATQGPTTFKQQVQNIANHDLAHLGQLVDICQAAPDTQEEPIDG